MKNDHFMDLTADSGTMRFAAQSTDLAGTAWIVSGYNSGREAVASPIFGTELTATFGQDGTLSGSAGCNNYNASYQVDGASMTIGPAVSTRKACAGPEGIMDQELQYLAALQTAATYELRGDKLEMRTAEGLLAVTLVAANK
jgi:heat shock protein HslJ